MSSIMSGPDCDAKLENSMKLLTAYVHHVNPENKLEFTVDLITSMFVFHLPQNAVLALAKTISDSVIALTPPDFDDTPYFPPHQR